ncbi:molybdopterin molybdotransferase MoeA [Hoeflea sp. WL0058]|uniref:Molybdopterin molybdenumtransferase n=1 Tax=Flavimaribacter sediminis TaxID=2865987 RepID=A0AAE2ZN51_9HYPH|nr:gephyrin-like molybdotransferase Glp [Flavimaribacter sediminis]MBW8636407.1 molybdopterin molybdotransferase MoeA [Flavimaribacter sediminis]
MTRTASLLNDCFLHDKDRLRHSEVLDLLKERLTTVAETEICTLSEALGRFLSTPVVAPRDVPLHDNSAVDGFAFLHADYLETGTLRSGPVIAAGDLADYSLGKNEAARIFTGAAIPDGADTVAMQEDCTVADNQITVPPGLKTGANLRKAGEDIKSGEIVTRPGKRLRPQEIASLASLGLSEVSVYRRIRVAIISTGNELLEAGRQTSIETGQVFDSNSAMLLALCASLPVTVSRLGIVPDVASAVEDTIARAAATHDVILTTGGASRGDEDHVVATIDRLGKRHAWQIAIKPGRPMTFGQIGDCVFMGLPGNPVAAFVCFLLYCRPALTILGGGDYIEPTRFPVAAGFTIDRKKPDRREFLRGWLTTGESGPVARKFERDGSGLISGLRAADGLIELDEETRSLTIGQTVSYIPFSEFGL